MKNKAFTLIELLVVIAIIAILAAILFPVFAQAKVAAKKTADISNQKQMGLGVFMYATDFDDLMPTMYRFTSDNNGGGTWRWNYWVSCPVGWPQDGAHNLPARMGEDSHHWSNIIQPYVKNYGLYEAPGMAKYDLYGIAPSPGFPVPALSALSINGILQCYNSTAIARPSSLTLFWTPEGNKNCIGGSLTDPALTCTSNITAQPCLYTGDGAPPGGAWFVTIGTEWVYGQGQNFTMCDTSTHFRHLGGTTGNTDANWDPWTGYDAYGNPMYMWFSNYGTGLSYPWLFRPDYTFNQ